MNIDPELANASTEDYEFLFKCFFTYLRESKFETDGQLSGLCAEPMAGSSIRSAASHLSQKFRMRKQRSPLHQSGSKHYLPILTKLFKSFDLLSLPVKRQRAITPHLLEKLGGFNGKREIQNFMSDHAADICVGGFFFGCRACEAVKPPTPGRTRTLRLKDIKFRDKSKRIIPINDPNLDKKAHYVTLTFTLQKNEVKMEKRTQERTFDLILCPCIRWGRAVMRVLKFVPNASPDTLICVVHFKKSRFITKCYLLKMIRKICNELGGKDFFGFD